MTNRLFVKEISLISPARNYSVKLRAGVNVVMGPIFTGKSSIMELIDYACGAKRPLGYPEIKKCSDVLVHMEIGGENLTIRRSLANSSAKALIYFGTMADVLSGAKIESKEVGSKHEKNKESISSEILARLGLGNIEVKSAPTQEASDTNAFSLRDLLRLLYIKQSRMGANPGFFEDDFTNFIKWQAAFKIVHGLYDSKATNISKLLKQTKDEKKELEDRLSVIQKFLAESQVPTREEIIKRIEQIITDKKRLAEKAERTKAAEIIEIGPNTELIDRRQALQIEVEKLSAQSSELERTLLQLGRLRVQYAREFNQLEFLRESSKLLSPLPILRCPACLQHVAQEANETTCYTCHRKLKDVENGVVVESQLKALHYRIGDLEKYTLELSSKRLSLQKETTEIVLQQKRIDTILESVRKRAVFPSDRMLLESAAALSELEREEDICRRNLNWLGRARGDGTNLLALQERINSLQNQLEQLRSKRPSADRVLAELSIRFSEILKFIKFPWNVDSARLDPEHFIPIVRDQDYKEIRSNGAITLIQCAWEFALLDYALSEPSLLPTLLMLDSPLNHLGRNSSDPEFRDQQIVDLFYKYLDQVDKNHGKEMQIIICDNSPPLWARHLVNIEYSGKREEGRYGLIEDEYQPT